MPPKRRGPQAKSTKQAQQAQPSKSPPVSVPPPAPAPPPPPPPQPLESDATRVRKEWSKFMDTWYEPQKKKLVDKLQKDLLVKYKDLGPPKGTQKLREMDLFERLDSIAQQLAQPARTEWERRLDLAQLREEQWDDMSGEEQRAVMGVFVGFADIDMDGDISADPSSVEEEDGVVEEPQYRGIPFCPPGPSAPPRQPVPLTSTRTNFEFVNPTSFFADPMTPPNPSKNLPALSMDHLATLGPSNAGRSGEPASASVGGVPSFQNWASEAGIVTQQPQVQSSALVPAQSLSARPRATDMSRQVSAASNLSSPHAKISSPQYSPPNLTTKFSPAINADSLPLGKRYIGPVIAEEEPDSMDEGILKSKMADEYQQYKISLRIQMIYQFHAEAAEFEIKLFETLLADDGTKESRARAVQEHETSMMRLREQKEEERKRLCAEERERRREEMRQHLTQRRSAQNRDADAPKANPPKPTPLPDKLSAQSRQGKATHQKENVPLATPAVPAAKLEPPSVVMKSNSTLSQDEASANEEFFANAMAMMAQGKPSAALSPAQASQNEALFSSAAAMLATQVQPGNSGKSTLQPSSIMKKSLSARAQDYDIPHITVSFAQPPTAPEPAQPPSTAAKGKKGKRGQPAVQPTKPVAITEEPEPEMDAEPPPPAPSLWDAATDVARNAWSAASASISVSKPKFGVSVEVEEDPDLAAVITLAPVPPRGNPTPKKAAPATKKGKKVTIAEEPDVDADPIASPPVQPTRKAKTTKGGWGPVGGKSKATSLFAEESEVEPTAPPPPVLAMPAWGKKTAPMGGRSRAVSLSAEESEPEPAAPPAPAPAVPAWGKKTATTGGKSKVLSPFAEENEPELAAPPVVPAWGKKMPPATKSTPKLQSRVALSEEQENDVEENFVPSRKNKAKSAWDVPSVPLGASTGTQGKKTTQPQTEPRRATRSGSKSARVDTVPDPEDELEVPEQGMPSVLEGVEGTEEVVEEEEGDASAWFNPENMNYWANFMGGSPEVETPAAPPAAEQTGEHVRWTPTMNEESEDESLEDADAELATSMWMQYAISGGDIPSLGGALEEPQVVPPESVQQETSWEQGKGKKKTSPGGDSGNRAQQTLVFDRAAFTGQWPKMESWLSPPSRGQSSGSARVF